MDINIESQIVVQTSAQWAADNTVYSAKRSLVTSDVYYGSTDQRKFKIADGVQTWSNLDYMPIEQVTTSTIGSAINGAASATPNDTDLVMSVESSVAKKNTWTQVKAFLKTYFDTVYTTTSAVATQITTALSSYATQAWVTSQGYITNVITALGYTPENAANKDATGGYVGLTLFKINFKNAANTFTSFFTNTNTAARTYTFQDRNGTIADDTDLAGKADKSNTVLTTYLEIPEQSKPATPTNATRIYVDTSNRLSWIGENGYVRTFDGTANTADRTYTLPNTSGTIPLGTGTANELTYFSGTNTIASLTTATYPSLTELSYVKGLTSAVQTQLNSKGYTLIGGTSAITPADSTTYFFGGVQSQSLLSAENVTTKMPIPKTGTIKSVQFSFIGNGSSESSTMLLRLNATTDYTISTTTDMSSSLVANYALSIPVTQGDTFCFKWTTPAWVTNPANLRFHIVVYIE